MIAHKHISKIILAVTAVAVILCFAATVFADELTEMLGGTGVKMEYETKLFDTSEVIELNIVMDDSEWETMLNNAMSEEYYVCDVVINGTRVNNVAIRPKGNTSLSAIAMDPDTDRYSLKLEFDHFVKGQTCFGLDKLILNNNYADATNMKEAVIYDMYQYLDVDASLYNYAKVSVNGEYRGVYLALEGVEQSFMLRNFGTRDGELYKPDTMEMGGDNAGGGFSMGGGGANLNYTDDDLDSYSTIWDSEVTGTSKGDHRRVVTALKNVSAGTDLEEYLDVDNVLRYMAVHTFAVNMDSLSGSMTTIFTSTTVSSTSSRGTIIYRSAACPWAAPATARAWSTTRSIRRSREHTFSTPSSKTRNTSRAITNIFRCSLTNMSKAAGSTKSITA